LLYLLPFEFVKACGGLNERRGATIYKRKCNSMSGRREGGICFTNVLNGKVWGKVNETKEEREISKEREREEKADIGYSNLWAWAARAGDSNPAVLRVSRTT
jgi:hypothetical protein